VDGDSIGIICFAAVVFGLITAFVLWAQRRDRRRKKAVTAMASANGFEMIEGKHPPENFPLARFPVVRWGEKGGRSFSRAARGYSNGREVLFFDYFLAQERSYKNIVVVVAQTIVAVRGGTECFPAAKNDLSLQLETVEDWTIAYWDKRILTAEELQSLISSIPPKKI
jgi:hypothetical protein